MTGVAGKHILLLVTGGIAAYKALELIRLIQKAGGSVQVVMTAAAQEFVTPLSAATLSGKPVLSSLFDLTQETEIGHIELSRSADLIVVAPASADFLAKMAHGLANDLASTTVLATDTDILVAPAMNVRMWQAKATTRNLAQLRADGVTFVGPDEGDMACGEFGPGRMSEPTEIVAAIDTYFARETGPLSGKHVIVTSGPTREPVDPVRYISNLSSGKQGTAIGAALAALGARVSFITGPAEAPPPAGCEIVNVTTAVEMHDAVFAALPADAAIFCAAVADWRAADISAQKMKKRDGQERLNIELVRNPDILRQLSQTVDQRPKLVVGFAAETENLRDNARAKLTAKGCDWIIGNDVSASKGTFGGNENEVIAISFEHELEWGRLSKTEVGHKLAAKVAAKLAQP